MGGYTFFRRWEQNVSSPKKCHRDLAAPRPCDIVFVPISVTLYSFFCSSCERYRNSKTVPIKSQIHRNTKNNYIVYGIKYFVPVTDIGTKKMAKITTFHSYICHRDYTFGPI